MKQSHPQQSNNSSEKLAVNEFTFIISTVQTWPPALYSLEVYKCALTYQICEHCKVVFITPDEHIQLICCKV